MNLKIRKVKPTNSRFLFYPERRHLMSEGLRPHRHCYFEVESRRYFDKNRGCAIRKTHYECMICGHEFYETVELSHDPPQYKNKNNVLNRNRNRG